MGRILPSPFFTISVNQYWLLPTTSHSSFLPSKVVPTWNNTSPLSPDSKGSSASGSKSSRLPYHQGTPEVTANTETDESVSRRRLILRHVSSEI
jgi:hypothetical protein